MRYHLYLKDWKKLQSLIFWQWSGETEAHTQLMGVSNGTQFDIWQFPVKLTNAQTLECGDSTSIIPREKNPI